MTKYKHIHLPAKPLTRQIKPCSIDNNYKKTARVFERYKKGKTYFCQSIKTENLKPQQGVNTAYFDKGMTARLGLDGSKSRYGYYNLTLPVILLTSMIVSCLPAHAVTNSAFEMRLQAYPQNDTLYNSERLKKGGYQTEATFSPYLGTFSVPQNVKTDFLHTLEAMEKRNTFVLFRHVKNLSKPDIETPSNDRQMKNPLTDVKSWRYDGDLSKKVLAVKPNRYSLAIFVPDSWSNSQFNQLISTNPFPYSQGKTVVSMVSNLPPSYNGLSLQNKRAFRRICRAVANTTERHTRYPMIIHTVFTQKVLGGLYHA